MNKIITFTDGGSRGNPGPAAIGGVLYDEKKNKIDSFKECIGKNTNNQAEYCALLKALELAKKHKAEIVECFLDSELVVKQMKREYKVKDKGLAVIFVHIWNIAIAFKKISFHHIPREKNQEADALVNEALDNM